MSSLKERLGLVALLLRRVGETGCCLDLGDLMLLMVMMVVVTSVLAVLIVSGVGNGPGSGNSNGLATGLHSEVKSCSLRMGEVDFEFARRC